MLRGATAWTEEQTRQNFEAVKAMVVPGSPGASKLLRHPLARAAGGDVFHGGGQHWTAKDDPDWQVLAAWVNGATLATAPADARVARIIQTNAAGDNIHLIDPATNKVVGVINDIEVPHGVTSAPDGTRLYFTNESLHTLDVVDAHDAGGHRAHPAQRPAEQHRGHRQGRQARLRRHRAGARRRGCDRHRDAHATRSRSPVKGAIHNVYVTPDGKYVVSGSIPGPHDHRDRQRDRDHRVGAADVGRHPADDVRAGRDGSTSRIFVQLSDYHGIAVVDFTTRKEVSRFEHAGHSGRGEAHRGPAGRAGARPGVTPDGKMLLATSKVYSQLYAYSLPDLKPIGTSTSASIPSGSRCRRTASRSTWRRPATTP